MVTEICPGVRELDHTADLGILVEAPSREALFHRAAAGMFALVYGDEPGATTPAGDALTEWRVSVEASDAAGLLVRWLSELLYAHEMEGDRYAAASFDVLTDTSLSARVEAVGWPRPPVREVKGVTYHDLEVARVPDGWRARVVFDV